jgi:nebulin
VYYKDDLNWTKGIGCYVWDTPELVRAKNAHLLQSEVSTKDDVTSVTLTVIYTNDSPSLLFVND